MTDRDRPLSDHDRHLTDIVTAAGCLGISTDALRKRLARGLVPGEKRDGRWFVWLPQGAAPERERPPASVSLLDHTDRHDGHMSDIDRHLTVMSDTLTELREQVQWLRARVEAAETAQAELRRLWLASIPPADSLAAKESNPPPDSDRTRPPRPWWRFWGRA